MQVASRSPCFRQAFRNSGDSEGSVAGSENSLSNHFWITALVSCKGQIPTWGSPMTKHFSISALLVFASDGYLYLQQMGGEAAGITTFGVGTSPSDFVSPLHRPAE